MHNNNLYILLIYDERFIDKSFLNKFICIIVDAV